MRVTADQHDWRKHETYRNRILFKTTGNSGLITRNDERFPSVEMKIPRTEKSMHHQRHFLITSTFSSHSETTEIMIEIRED